MKQEELDFNEITIKNAEKTETVNFDEHTGMNLEDLHSDTFEGVVITPSDFKQKEIILTPL